MQCASKQVIVANQHFPWGRIYVAGKIDVRRSMRTLGTVLVLAIFKLAKERGFSSYKETLLKQHDFVGSLRPHTSCFHYRAYSSILLGEFAISMMVFGIYLAGALLMLNVLFLTAKPYPGGGGEQAWEQMSLTGTTRYTDPVEFQILENMYNAMDGDHWQWSTDYDYDGTPWRFDLNSSDPNSDPCRGHWQGIYCSPICSVPPCHIFYMNLTRYGLNGIMPPGMFNFTMLGYMYLSENNIQGQIPAVNQLPELILMNLSYNSLNGTIPSCLGKATALNLLYLSNNHLVGSIPETFTDLVNLQYLYLLNNHLTGTLPEKLGNLKQLSFLNLGVNRFHGTLPASISQLTKLEQLYLNNNTISGPFPAVLPYSLTKISLECNKLTGKVPQIFEKYQNLSVLKINDNFLTGPPPICLSTLSHLEILQLHLNKFTGPIGPLFDPKVQTKLTNIDLSHNSLSGEIPATIFQLPSLRTIAAVKNCFSGTLPETICEARNLNVISLDGLTSSTYCVQFLWDPLHYFNSGYFAKSMRGKIPDCIWSLPNLTSLHLAGNSFTGQLFNPDNSTVVTTGDKATGQVSGITYGITPTLKNVSLSHNRLTGTIPREILQFPFCNLDLSYNRLLGHITDLAQARLRNTSTDANEGTAINLEVNRLSGDIPRDMETAYGVNILTGNVFQCTDYSKLPHQDPAYHYYVCGSDELNQSMIAFVVLFVTIVLGLVVAAVAYYASRLPRSEVTAHVVALLQRVRGVARYVLQYTSALGVQVDSLRPPVHVLRPHSDKYPNYLHFLSSLNLLRRIFLWIAVYVLVPCLPIYLLFYLMDPNTSEYSTHTDRYNWISTTVFLSGQVPAVTLFCLWLTMCSFLVGYVLYLFNVTYKVTLSDFGAKLMSFSSGGRSSESSKGGKQVSFDEDFPMEVTDDTHPDTTTLRESLYRSSSLEVPHKEMRVSYADTVTIYPLPPADVDMSSTSASACPTGADRRARDLNGSTLSGETERMQASSPVPQSNRSTLTSATDSPVRSSMKAKDFPTTSSPASTNKSFSFSLSYRASELITVVRKKVNCLSILPMSVLFLLNAVATITANILYVYIMYSNITSTALFFVQVSMAAFKLFWNLVVVRKLISHIPYNKGSIRMHSLMLIFNSLIAPCFASAFTDSACFRDLVFGSDLMTTTYSYESCLEAYQEYNGGQFVTVCTHYADIQYVTDYNPPFVYNYSCGSSILTSYIPVYIYSYTMLALLLPLVFLALASVPTKYIPKFLLKQIDAILRPQDRSDSTTIPINAVMANGRPSAMAAVFVQFQHVFKARSVQALAIQHLTILLTFGITSPMLAIVVCAAIVIDTYTIQTLMIRYVEYQTKTSVFYNTFNTNSSGSNSSGSVRDSLNSSRSSGKVRVSMPQRSSGDQTAAHPGGAESEVEAGGADPAAENERTSLLSSNSGEGSGRNSGSDASNDHHALVARIYEEERMCELDAICAGTWRSLRHTIWMVYYFCIVFYSALLFDVVGDSRGLQAAISVPISALVVGVFFRLFMSTIVTELRNFWKTSEEAKYEAYKAESASVSARSSEQESGMYKASDNDVDNSGLESNRSSEVGAFDASAHDLTAPLV